MKKFPIVLLLSLMLFAACQAPDEKKTESVLLYAYGSTDSSTSVCYRDLASQQPEACFPFQEYYLSQWISSEKALLGRFVDSEEYYTFELGTNSIECITCSLNSTSHKSLSPSMRKVLLFTDNNVALVDLNNPDKAENILSDRSVSWLDWSPDESFLVFVDQSTHLYRLDLKDHALTELLPGVPALQIFDVHISPQGDKAAFYLLDENENFSLAAVSVDGTNFHMLADLTPKTKKMIGSENSPSAFTWSPNGKEIAFTAPLASDPTGYERSLFVVDLEDMKPKLILDSPTNKFSPAWSLDGSFIAFVDNGDAQDIWTVAPDGTNLTNQTNTPARDEYAPDWK